MWGAHVRVCVRLDSSECIIVEASVDASFFKGGEGDRTAATEVMLCEETGSCRQIAPFPPYRR